LKTAASDFFVCHLSGQFIIIYTKKSLEIPKG